MRLRVCAQQTILEGQNQRRGDGDDVGYVLARTVRSCILHEASKALGAVGPGNQCKRGKCMEAAMAMSCGKKMDGIPQPVVWALARY